MISVIKFLLVLFVQILLWGISTFAIFTFITSGGDDYVLLALSLIIFLLSSLSTKPLDNKMKRGAKW